MNSPENSPGISDSAETCDAEFEMGYEGEVVLYCDLPRGHHGNHHGCIEEEWPLEQLGPKHYTPGQLKARERWLEIYGPLLRHALNSTPLPRFSNTSEQTSGGTVRFDVLSTTTETQAPTTPNTTSSATPATPTETQ